MIKAAVMIHSNPNSEPQDRSNNLIPFINYQAPAPQRCLDMLLAKYNGESYQSEVMMHSCDTFSVPQLQCKLSSATVLLITDGGLVPAGNPDHIPSTCSDRFGIYSIEDMNSLHAADFEISHQGYDNSYVREDPNRLLPVDALRELEKEGFIGKLYDHFLSTTGVMVSTEQSRTLGSKIADYIRKHPVDAVLLSSACGTSTRCGAYIGLAIKDLGVPVVQVTNLTQIAVDTGISRVIKGNSICHPFGNPSHAPRDEYAFRKALTIQALKALSENGEGACAE